MSTYAYPTRKEFSLYRSRPFVEKRLDDLAEEQFKLMNRAYTNAEAKKRLKISIYKYSIYEKRLKKLIKNSNLPAIFNDFIKLIKLAGNHVYSKIWNKDSI